MAAALVTGAAGFIGSHLSESLVRLGWNVRGLDAFTDTYDPRLKRANVRGLLQHPRFELIIGDLTIADLAAVLDGVGFVAHLAGEAGVTSSWGNEFPRYLRRNVLATQRLLEAARVRGVERLVYASSSSVYGGHDQPSTASLPRPVSPYGASKLAGESLVSAYAHGHGVPAVSLRYFSVYGPRQRPDMAAHRFIEAALDQRPVTVYGDGRDVVLVGRVVPRPNRPRQGPFPGNRGQHSVNQGGTATWPTSGCGCTCSRRTPHFRRCRS